MIALLYDKPEVWAREAPYPTGRILTELLPIPRDLA